MSDWIAPPIQRLLNFLRTTDMPWIADDIEAHLRLGLVPVYDPKSDTERHQAELDQRMNRAPKDERPPSDEEKGEPFPIEKQIDAALMILECEIVDRVRIIEDSESLLRNKFNLENINLGIVTENGVAQPLLTQKARKAAEELSELRPQLRAWLLEGAQLKRQ